jgi:hypothetical protein
MSLSKGRIWLEWKRGAVWAVTGDLVIMRRAYFAGLVSY